MTGTNVVSREGGNSDGWLINVNAHIFARRGGNFDVSAEGSIKTWLMRVLSHLFLLDKSCVSDKLVSESDFI